MKINLTDYVTSFTVFDPEFQATSPGSALQKAKTCYEKTKEFLNVLDKHSSTCPSLKPIKATLEDMNQLFVESLLVQTNGALKLDNNLELPLARLKAEKSHILAKHYIKQPYEFLKVVITVIDSYNADIERASLRGLDDRVTIDTVDSQLLNNSTIQLGFQDKFFGGNININARTYRSNASLFANGDFQAMLAKPSDLPENKELSMVISSLQQFVYRTGGVNNKFGFIPE